MHKALVAQLKDFQVLVRQGQQPDLVHLNSVKSEDKEVREWQAQEEEWVPVPYLKKISRKHNNSSIMEAQVDLETRIVVRVG